VAAIEDFLFLAWERASGTAWRTAFRRLLLPGGLTSLTTFVGFASLCTADLGIVRRFGLWGALGAALEWIATFVVLPAALTLRPSLAAWSRPDRALPHAWVERVARLRLPRAVAWAALLVLPLAGRAQEPKPQWELGAGATALRIPDYRGSDQSRNYFFPIPYFIYRGDKLRMDRQGPRAILVETRRVELDFSTFLSPNVKSEDNHARTGMPGLEPVVEIGPQLNFIVAQDPQREWRFDLRLPARAAVATDLKHSRGVGYTVYPHAWLSARPEFLGGRWNLSLQAGPMFASREYHDYFYTVAPQFATPDRPAYQAPGGYSGALVLGSLGRRFGKLWVGGFVRYDSLRGAAFEPSPLVLQHYSAMAGVAFAWVFTESSKRVEAWD